VVRWCRESQTGKSFNVRSADHQAKERLSNWLQTNSQENIVSFFEVEEKAAELMGGQAFKPSRSWLRRFLRQEDPQNKLFIEEDE